MEVGNARGFRCGDHEIFWIVDLRDDAQILDRSVFFIGAHAFVGPVHIFRRNDAEIDRRVRARQCCLGELPVADLRRDQALGDDAHAFVARTGVADRDVIAVRRHHFFDGVAERAPGTIAAGRLKNGPFGGDPVGLRRGGLLRVARHRRHGDEGAHQQCRQPCRVPLDGHRSSSHGILPCTFFLPGYQRRLSLSALRETAYAPVAAVLSGRGEMVIPGHLYIHKVTYAGSSCVFGRRPHG